jgi:tetratricopeptide (TPR) repeat protein
MGRSAAEVPERETSAIDVKAQIFSNLGPHRRTVTTTSGEAQAYFDQGLTWMYAFNHDEAVRSFMRAAELDEDCAMAWWGASLASGPQYNHPVLTEERTATAWEAMQMALGLIEHTTPIERALIEALKMRNPKEEPDKEGRAKLNKSYANAMERIWRDNPNDPDIGALYAEAMMLLRPWKLYSVDDHTPHENTPQIVSVLERVIATDPDHPGALHLYIHAIEPSKNPSMGLFAADRLCDLVPGSGHLLHMPCHIYVQTGKWDNVIVQSKKATYSDDGYRKLSPEQGVQYGYMVHNSHMLSFAAMMSGREREAMTAARAMWDIVPEDVLPKVGPFFDRWMCSVYDVQKRFGRWDDLIAEPAPPEYLPITQATWRACRAVAYAAKKDFPNAEREHELFREARERLPEDHAWSSREMADAVLKVSDHFIPGEIALQHGDWALAADHLEKAAEIEDTLSYGEPPQWLQPVRHTLGAVYLSSGNYREAERVYREDLEKWPNNGWSLFGLSRALKEQGKLFEAEKVKHQYDESWRDADAHIATSCKCIPAP